MRAAVHERSGPDPAGAGPVSENAAVQEEHTP